jgi:hypothetical protein
MNDHHRAEGNPGEEQNSAYDLLQRLLLTLLNQSAIFVGIVVGFLNVCIIRLRSLLLAASISSLI